MEIRKSVRLVDSNPPSSRWSLRGRRVSEVQFSRPCWLGQRAPVVACYLAPLLGPARAQPSWSGPRNCHAPTARANPRAGASGRLFGSSGTADWAFALIVTGYKGSRLAFVGWHLPTGGGARPASARPAPPQPGRTRRRPAAGAGPDAAPGGELGSRTANRLDGADAAGPQNSAVGAGPWRRMILSRPIL